MGGTHVGVPGVELREGDPELPSESLARIRSLGLVPAAAYTDKNRGISIVSYQVANSGRGNTASLLL